MGTDFVHRLFVDRADLEGANGQTRVLRNEGNGVIEIAGFECENPAEDLSCLREGAVADDNLASVNPDGGCILCALERLTVHIVAATAQLARGCARDVMAATRKRHVASPSQEKQRQRRQLGTPVPSAAML